VTTAVVFGYGDVGVRCLATLLAGGVHVSLVVTHADDPGETQWYASLARYAAERDIPVHLSDDATGGDLADKLAACAPDFLFSFYYRRMIPSGLLSRASRGALNMHGSLLPQFRGRAPVNWAVLMGATETGASLHYMEAKPDAGNLVDQMAVPILPDDTAYDVFRKVCAAAEFVLHRSLPALLAGSAPSRVQELAAGRYFGARRPEDGVIDWAWSARRIHDLVRAVAPPFPAARTLINGEPARILRTVLVDLPAPVAAGPVLFAQEGRCYARCGDGAVLRLLELELVGHNVDPAALAVRLGAGLQLLPVLVAP
jgi:methionyl-tRNA formyltransferase